jgi:methylated-DNA-protein-cysteine methyltransferase-like protein
MTSIPSLPDLEHFNSQMWEIVRQIPPGKVATYGQIAALIPPPPGLPPEEYERYRARWAGAAMALSPADVPWQRVINAQGKISPRKGAERQRELLEAEGIVFDSRGRIDLQRYAWRGPNEAWLRAHGLEPPAQDYRQDALPF